MATQFGYDPIWFVISVGAVTVENGSIHPPVGMSVRDPGAGARRQDHSIHRGIPFSHNAADADRVDVLVSHPRSVAAGRALRPTMRRRRACSKPGQIPLWLISD